MILNFQKVAIWKEMNEYKRNFLRCEQQISDLEVALDRSKRFIGKLDVFWNHVVHSMVYSML
jgi:hypothetical protein